MTTAQQRQGKKAIHSWKGAKPTTAFRGQLIYFTNADLTLRRPSGAILVIDRYEVEAISDGKTRLEPR